MSWISDRVQDAYDYLNPEPLHPAPDEPRMRGWRASPAAMGSVVDPGTADFMLPPTTPTWEAEHRYAPQRSDLWKGDAYWMSGGQPLPERSEADAYRMGGLAGMDQYGAASMPVFGKRNPSFARLDDERGAKDVGHYAGEFIKDWLLPKTPLDFGLMAAGPAGRVAGKGAAALTGAAGVMGELVDPAEAMFAGRLAKTANLAALKRAEQMGAKGASPNDIWTSTGWFQGADKKWRFEIPDQSAKWNLDPAALKALQTAREPMSMGEAFSHPELMKAYPELYKADFWVGLQPGGARATYSSGFGVDPPTISIHPDTASNMRSSNLHELQHGIQEIEGFAKGGSVFGGLRPGTPEWKIYQDTLSKIKTPTPKVELEKSGALGPEYTYEDYLREHKQSIRDDKLGLDRMAQETAMRESYRRSAGEVEARTVQARDRMTPEQMRDIPWLYQDVPTEQQIVKFREPLGALVAPDRYGAAP